MFALFGTVGFIAGFAFAIVGSVKSDKNAVECGIVKLNGKYYRITPLEGQDK